MMDRMAETDAGAEALRALNTAFTETREKMRPGAGLARQALTDAGGALRKLRSPESRPSGGGPALGSGTGLLLTDDPHA